MNTLLRCRHCPSFVPASASACPNCLELNVSQRVRATGPALARIPGPLRSLLAIGGGGLLSMTLSACYGGGCVDGYCFEDCSNPELDTDHDYYCLESDCDETNAAIHRYASDELGDGVDQNCDGADGIAPPPDAGGQGGDGGNADGGAATDAAATDAAATDAAAIEDAGTSTDGGLGIDGGSSDGGTMSIDGGSDASTPSDGGGDASTMTTDGGDTTADAG